MPPAEPPQTIGTLQDGAVRPSPEIIRVPPPAPAKTRGPVWTYVIVGAVTSIGLGVLLALYSMPPCAMLPGIIVPMVIVGAAFYARQCERVWESWQARATEFEEWRKHPIAARLASIWTQLTRLPHSTDVLTAIEAAGLEAPVSARVVCFGRFDIPEARDDRFEPIIITPTDFQAKGRGAIVVASLVLGLWALRRVGWIPALNGFPEPLLFAYAVAGVVIAARWVWLAGVRQAYVRLAPGVVQILQFGPFRTRPRIRSYPMTAGTVVVVGNSQPRPNTVFATVLLRDGHRDRIAFHQMRRPAEAVASFWRAVQSTAPTPPLSEDSLLG